MQKKSNLGRGLEALLGRKTEGQAPDSGAASATAAPNTEGGMLLPISQIVRAAYQPRQTFQPEALAELAQSIREKGVLQPLLVRPKEDGTYEIVAGERRWRASQLAGLSEIPVIIRELNDVDALEIAIIENLQRESLSPVEEARAYQTLIDKGRRQEDVAQAVGKSRSTITNALRLLSLPADILQAVEEGRLSSGHAKAILSQPEEHRLWAYEQISKRHLSVREAEQLSKEGQLTQKPEQKSGAKEPQVADEYREVELSLSRRTGTKVKIVDKGLEKGKGGKLELSFASKEELERLLELLGYAEGE